MSVVTQAFQVYLDNHKKYEDVRACTHSLKHSQWMAPKLF
jgi:hypothetical protein